MNSTYTNKLHIFMEAIPKFRCEHRLGKQEPAYSAVASDPQRAVVQMLVTYTQISIITKLAFHKAKYILKLNRP